MAELLALPQMSYWAAGGLLYLGFSAVLGVLLRRARTSPGFLTWLWTGSYAILLYLPATVFILQRADWPENLPAATLCLGVLAAMAGAWQPSWIPPGLWRARFGRQYFALSMAAAAVWGLSSGASALALSPAAVGLSALAAGAAAVLSSPRSP
jgi:hypothetical protein